MGLNNQKKGSKTKIFLVDDHPLVRRSLQLLIDLEKDLVVCGEADGVPVAYERIMALKPDMAIVDLSLKSGDGLDLIQQLRAARPVLKILVFTMSDEKFYVERALRAGVNAYVTKDEAAEKVVAVIRSVRDGKSYLSQGLRNEDWGKLVNVEVAADQSRGDCLTKREVEVMQLLGEGLSTVEIAERLGVSVKTVASHREHIKDKLNIRSSPELINYACTMLKTERRAVQLPPDEGEA